MTKRLVHKKIIFHLKVVRCCVLGRIIKKSILETRLVSNNLHILDHFLHYIYFNKELYVAVNGLKNCGFYVTLILKTS